jgi:hypothetical protein|tara:strand:- start:135 stop:488 length:354 start_codon:yes stop_codon:yes gene_type:complete
MLDYSTGKIYILINDNLPNILFIGSTTDSLYNRYRTIKYNHSRSKPFNPLFSKGDATIILLEDFSCKNKKELDKRKKEWINEYYVDNKFVICKNKYFQKKYQLAYKKINDKNNLFLV